MLNIHMYTFLHKTIFIVIETVMETSFVKAYEAILF